jgi:hypothetical protein
VTALLGELAGPRVRRVDLLHRQITVAEQLLEVRGRLAFGPTKTGAGRRTVTLPMVAAEALAEHLSVYAEVGPDGLVFPAERGGPIRRSNFTRRVWIPATEMAVSCWVGWWACQDLNLGPHPYQQNAGNRCAKSRSRRLRSTVGAKVMCSRGVQFMCSHPARPELEASGTLPEAPRSYRTWIVDIRFLSMVRVVGGQRSGAIARRRVWRKTEPWTYRRLGTRRAATSTSRTASAGKVRSTWCTSPAGSRTSS